MVIQHNIMSLNAHRQLGINNSGVSKNLEKLSSGYRINRAADDAAGLAISEKMRAQITGLSRATLNAQDGISLIQTAEGALTEVHSILNRLVDLSMESANGIMDDVDRDNIQAEAQALKDELDRISEFTNFNGKYLLNGDLSAIGHATTGTLATGAIQAGFNVSTAATISMPSSFKKDGTGLVRAGYIAPTSIRFYMADKDGGPPIEKVMDIGPMLTKEPNAQYVIDLGGFGSITMKNDPNMSGTGTLESLVYTLANRLNYTGARVTPLTPAELENVGIPIQVGDSSDSYNVIRITIDDMSTDGLEISGLTLVTPGSASGAISRIKEAINAVSTNRGNLGALQNRVEHTINNLGVMVENITQAESRIRDTDMAKEMMAFTKNNILTQSAQAMLAQANQQPQQVLQLMR